MRKQPLAARPRRALQRSHRLFLEMLEERVMLDASNVFARFGGNLAHAGDQQKIPLKLSPSDFTLIGSTVVLGFQLQAAQGSTLDPAAVQITDSTGASVVPRYINPDLASNTQSLNL